jgi:hydrogenase expression/formation protein HypC
MDAPPFPAVRDGTAALVAADTRWYASGVAGRRPVLVEEEQEVRIVCLAIPGQIVEITDEVNRLARVDVAGVRRTINVGLLDGVRPGDWVLIHVGFALSQVDEEEAMATLALLAEMGAEYEAELAELQGSQIE